MTNKPETDLAVVITRAKQLSSLGVEIQRGDLITIDRYGPFLIDSSAFKLSMKENGGWSS